MPRSAIAFAVSILFISFLVMRSTSPVVRAQPIGSEKAVSSEPLSPRTNRIAESINTARGYGAAFDRQTLFRNARAIERGSSFRQAVDEGVVLELSRQHIDRILRQRPAYISIELPNPANDGSFVLELERVNIFAEGFHVTTSDGTTANLREEEYGLHYRGIVKDQPSSIAAVSIFRNEIMGMISAGDGNLVLGRIEGPDQRNTHILYNDRRLKARPAAMCDVDGHDHIGTSLAPEFPAVGDSPLVRCVRIYVEANYDVFLNKGSVANTTAYVTGFFNQSATLIATTGVTATLSEVFVWTGPSPFTFSTTSQQLEAFRSFRTSFNGNLAHLVDLQNIGGRAYINAYCAGTFRYAYSGIFPTFQNVPTYSFTVQIFSHETGHNLGSQHTHACVWNGNNTAIDGCFTVEGTCPNPGLPPGGGTIMSYCYNTPAGVNFNLGYGPQPAAVISNSFNAASCLTDCAGQCTFSVSPASSSTFPSGGGTGSFSVTAPSGCNWSASVNAPGLSERAPEALFLNSTPITINDRLSNTGPPGTASLYPSSIAVSGQSGTVTRITASVNGLSHTFPDDVDILLVGPTGARTLLMSDVGGSVAVTGQTLTFDQSAAGALPDAGQLITGTYRPTDFLGSTPVEPGGIDVFPAPGPGQSSSFGANLNVFNGTNPNGTWQLYVVDDENVDSGSIATGWALSVETSAGSWITITSGSSGTGNGTVNYSVAANGGSTLRTGTITINNLTTAVHTVTQSGGGSVPAAPTANAASSITSSSFTANWSSSAGATGYRLDVSTSNTFGTFVAGFNNLDVGNVTNRSVTGLSAGTTYFYRLRAYNANGTSTNSGTIQVTTTGTAPAAPTANAASSVTANSFTANWNASAGATGYRLDVSTSNTFGSFVPGFNNLDVGNVTSANVTGLGAGTAYFYRVRAYNGVGTSGNSNTISVTTLAGCSYSINPTVQNFTATGGTGTVQVTAPAGCSWSAVVNSLAGGRSSLGGSLVEAFLGQTPQSYLRNDGEVPTVIFAGTGAGPIPDGGSGTPPIYGAPRIISFAVSGMTAPLSAVSVNLTLNHSWAGDLDMVLASPSGVASIVTVGHIGVTGAGQFGSSSDYAGQYNFTDAAAGTNIWTAAATTPIPAGNYRTTQRGGPGQVNPAPVTNLTAAFTGLSSAQVNGTWTLTVRDGAASDTGTISAASLDLTGGSPTNWLTINSGASGSGNGTVNYSVAANTTGAPRTKTMTIGGNTFTVNQSNTTVIRRPFDYDGDGRADFTVFRPSNGAWYLQRTTAGLQSLQFGASGDRLAPADYDGDGKADIAVFRAATGLWYILKSSTNTVIFPVFGASGDLPAPGDYDGDGKADLNVFRPSQGTWYRQNSSNGTFFGFQFGANGDVPTVGDFDGDGRNDLGIWRPSNGDWYNIRSGNGSVFGERFGQTGDKIAPADYDGDGKTDIAIWRPSTGLWVVRNSATATYSYFVFGAPADVPVAGDYDGDGRADIGVWRPSDGTWYISRSSNGQFIVFPWGQNGDRPTPSAYGN